MQVPPRRAGPPLGLDALLVLCAAAFGLWLLRPTWPLGWSADDGTHLWFSAQYPAWRYLLEPSLLRVASYAHLTPLMNVFYSANLHWFGLDAAAFRAAMLGIAALALAAYYLCLRQWVRPALALLGSGLLAASTPFFSVATTLMTNHYLLGFLFACLLVLCFVRWSRGGHAAWLVAAACAYALAVLGKEVYVPAIVLCGLLARGRRRWLGLAALAAVLALYLAWRVQVVGSLVGGYRSGVFVTGAEWLPVLRSLWKIPEVGLGSAAGVAAVAAAALVLLGLARPPAAWWAAAVVAAAMGLGPLLPLAPLGLVTQPDRYFLVLYALLCAAFLVLAERVLAAAPAPPRRWLALACLLPLGVVTGLQHRQFVPPLLGAVQAQSGRYAEALRQPGHFVLWAPDARNTAEETYWNLVFNHLRRAAALRAGHEDYPRALAVAELGAPVLRGLLAQGVPAFRFDAAGCRCFVPLAAAELAAAPPARAPFGPQRLQVAYEPAPGRVPETIESAWGLGTLDTAEIAPDDPTLLKVRGWIDLRREVDLLYAVLPFRDAVQAELRPEARPDVAQARNDPAYLASGFELRLRFTRPELAQQARAKLCIAVPALLRAPYALLRNQPAYCEAFIPPRYR